MRLAVTCENKHPSFRINSNRKLNMNYENHYIIEQYLVIIPLISVSEWTTYKYDMYGMELGILHTVQFQLRSPLRFFTKVLMVFNFLKLLYLKLNVIPFLLISLYSCFFCILMAGGITHP